MTHSQTDPVCGMDVTPGEAAGGGAEHAGTTYWFCNPSCRERFIADPARYLHPPTPAEPGPAAGQDPRVYTCPMHPEVRQAGPGAAPSAAWRSSRWRSPRTRARTPSSST